MARARTRQCTAEAKRALSFTHTYPADLKGDGETEALSRLLAKHEVALVDMGHTHYNELTNDGMTIFAATRSTGQLEEGPVGYSLTTVDRGIASWRFKALDDPFPFVLITSPADHRLARGSSQRVDREFEVRARIFGHVPIARAECRIEGGHWLPMSRIGTGLATGEPRSGRARTHCLTSRSVCSLQTDVLPPIRSVLPVADLRCRSARQPAATPRP